MYHLPTFGGPAGLARLVQTNTLQQYVTNLLPLKCREPFLYIQRHQGSPTQATDQATATLAGYFEQDCIVLPIRLPTLAEVIRESEIAFIFDQSLTTIELMHEEHKRSLVGNFFKPSAFEAAILGGPGSHGFLHFCRQGAFESPRAAPLAVEKASAAHLQLLSTVKRTLKMEDKGLNSICEAMVAAEYGFLRAPAFFDKFKVFGATLAGAMPVVASKPFLLKDLSSFVLARIKGHFEPKSGVDNLLQSSTSARLGALVAYNSYPFEDLHFSCRQLLPGHQGELEGWSTTYRGDFVAACRKHLKTSGNGAARNNVCPYY